MLSRRLLGLNEETCISETEKLSDKTSESALVCEPFCWMARQPMDRIGVKDHSRTWSIATDCCSLISTKYLLKFKRVLLKKIFVHPQKKIRKIRKKSEKTQGFFVEDLTSVHLIWEWTTPRFKCLNPFLFITSTYTQKKNRKKSKKNPEKSKDYFWGFNPTWEWTTPLVNPILKSDRNFSEWRPHRALDLCGNRQRGRETTDTANNWSRRRD